MMMMMMTTAVPATASSTPPPPKGNIQRLNTKQTHALFENPETAGQKKLKKAANDFEAVFVQQLIDAMDKTVDREDSLLSGGEAEKTFRGMLNQQMATNIAQSSSSSGNGFGMAQSVFEQSVQLLEEPTVPAEKPVESAGKPKTETPAFGMALSTKAIPLSLNPKLKPFQKTYGASMGAFTPLNTTLKPL
jgi:Rod binding domain-containing protein